MHYITKNYVLKLIYNDENECINDTLSPINTNSEDLSLKHIINENTSLGNATTCAHYATCDITLSCHVFALPRQCARLALANKPFFSNFKS